MKLKLPTKSDIKVSIPDKAKLEDLFFRGYHIKKLIEVMEMEIIKCYKEQKQLNNTNIMKRYRLLKLRIDRYNAQIIYEYKKFKKMFDEP